MAAVRAAAEIGADGVEVDVWLSADKHLIVNHDRTHGGLALPTSTWAELARVAPPAELEEVLGAAGSMRVNVEIKAGRSAPYNLEVARTVARFLDSSTLSSRCLVSSFSLAICEEVHRASPERPVGWLVRRRPARFAIDQVVRSRLTSAHFSFSRVSRQIADLASKNGIDLHVWTANLPRDIDRMLDLGVAALITDDVVLAQDLRERHRPRPASNDGVDWGS